VRSGPPCCATSSRNSPSACAVLAYSHGVDDLGPRLRQLTKPAQLDKKRFELEWVLPLEPGLSTDVTRHTGDFAATMPSPPIEAAHEND
jgi:hypothetical protein